MTAIFAHRGCHGVPAPRENTIPAFRGARRLGADGVELDVRATADGALAVLHDQAVPGIGDVTNIVAAQLPEEVALLDGALAACSGLWVNVEIKGGPGEAVLVGKLLSTVGAGKTGADRVFVSSFDPGAIAAVPATAAQVPRGLLVDWRADPYLALERAVSLGCATLHPFVAQVDAELVEVARARGLGIHVWTVNADADISAMGALGVEAIITDRVPATLGILRTGGTGPGHVAGAGSPRTTRQRRQPGEPGSHEQRRRNGGGRTG